jgi:hypothetical protein
MDEHFQQPRLAREGPMIDVFQAHPATVGQTYWQHLRFAARTGAAMIASGTACVVHRLFPFLFVTTGSQTIRRLAQRLEGRQAKSARSSPGEVPILGFRLRALD